MKITKIKMDLNNLKKIGIGILSVPITMISSVYLVKLCEIIQDYVYKIDSGTLIYHDLYGKIWMIPFMASFIFGLLLSSIFVCVVMDRKSFKKVLYYNAAFLVIWCGTLLIALPHYAYITKEGIHIRTSYFQDEKYYNWQEVKNVNGEFYSTVKGGQHFSYIFAFEDKNEYRINFSITETNEEIRKFKNLIETNNLAFKIWPYSTESYLKLFENK